MLQPGLTQQPDHARIGLLRQVLGRDRVHQRRDVAGSHYESAGDRRNYTRLGHSRWLTTALNHGRRQEPLQLDDDG